jgi:hypothetical protein
MNLYDSYISGTLTVSGAIVPSANLAFDLGTTSNNFRHLYVGSGSIYMGGNKILGLNSDGSILLGTQTIQTSASLAAGSTTNAFTGSVIVSGSLNVSSNLIVTGSITTTGALGIGTTSSLAGYSLRVSKNITGAATSYGIVSDGIIQSDVTSTNLFSTIATTALGAGLTSLSHYRAAQGTFDSGSDIGIQYGFIANLSLTGAVSNYGFYGGINSGSNNNFNLYMAGSAPNLLLGNTGIGKIPTTGIKLDVSGSTLITGSLTTTGSLSTFLNFVSIGTTSSLYPLAIYASTTQTSIGLMSGYANAGARNWGIATNNQAYGDFNLMQSTANGGDPFGAGTSKLYFSPAGYLGINKTGSNTQLDVNGNATITGSLIVTGSNVGVGTTPSAWDSTWKIVELYNQGNFVGGESGKSTWLGSNNIYSGSAYKYVNANGAAQYILQNDDVKR